MSPAVGRMLKGFEVAVRVETVAFRVYPLAATLMLRLEKLAMPLAFVVAVRVPDSVPPPALFAIAMVTDAPAIPTLEESASLTWTAGAMPAPLAVSAGCPVKLRVDPAPTSI